MSVKGVAVAEKLMQLLTELLEALRTVKVIVQLYSAGDTLHLEYHVPFPVPGSKKVILNHCNLFFLITRTKKYVSLRVLGNKRVIGLCSVEGDLNHH